MSYPGYSGTTTGTSQMDVINSPVSWSSFPEKLLREGVIDELFGLGFDRVDDKIGRWFHRSSMDQAEDVDQALSGMTQFQTWEDHAGFDYDNLEAMWEILYSPADYNKGLEFTRRTQRDIKYGVIEEAVTEFGFMAKVTMQQQAVSWIEDNATFPGDAVAFFHTAHPLSARVGSPTWPNLINGQFTIENVQLACNYISMCPNHVNVCMGLKPAEIWYHPNRRWEVQEMLESQWRSDNPNQAKNTLKGILTPIEWEFFTSEDAVYIKADRHRMKWKDRETLQRRMYTTDETHAKRYQAWYSAARGASDWRGVVKITGS